MKNREFELKALAELLMEELQPRKGAASFKRFLIVNGYDADTLADMGFSESFLYGLGMSVEEKKEPEAKPQKDMSALRIRDRVISLIPFIRDSRTHIAVMDELNGLAGDLNEFCFSGDMELTYKTMRGIFEAHIAENGIVDKAETEGCHTMEYLGLSESEAYSLMGEDAA